MALAITACAVNPQTPVHPTETITVVYQPYPTLFPTQAPVLWSADHESGDLSQWTGNELGGIWITSTADAEITTAHAHSGRYAVALTIYNANGRENESPGVRLARIGTAADPHSLPREAYYSVWYYFPQVVLPALWWNIFQWKRKYVLADGTASSDPVYTVNIANRPNGRMYLYLYRHVGKDGRYNTAGVGLEAAADIDLPVNQWVHFECDYLWSSTHTGRVACWQDGQPIWDIKNVITEYDYGQVDQPRQWTVNNYSEKTDPPTQTIYIDDAMISSIRMGP